MINQLIDKLALVNTMCHWNKGQVFAVNGPQILNGSVYAPYFKEINLILEIFHKKQKCQPHFSTREKDKAHNS